MVRRCYSYGATALGAVAHATGTSSIAIGAPKIRIDNQGSTAMEYITEAEGESSIAIGAGSVARPNAKSSIVIGHEAKVEDAEGISMGRESNSWGKGSVAIGTRSYARGENSIAIGVADLGEKIEYDYDYSGEFATITGSTAVSIYESTTSGGAGSIAMGVSAKTVFDDSIAIGTHAETRGNQDVAIGKGAISNGGVALMGTINKRYNEFKYEFDEEGNLVEDAEKNYEVGESNFAVHGDVTGARAYTIGGAVEGMDSFAVGSNANVEGNYSNSIGMSSSVLGNSSIAIGDYANVTADRAQAFGNQASVMSEGGLALGTDSAVNKNSMNSIAIGPSTSVSGFSSIAIGNSTTAVGTDSIAIGSNAETSSEQTIVIGGHAQTDDVSKIGINSILSMAIGQSASIGDNAQVDIALGAESKVTDGASYAIAIGNSTVVGSSHSIAFGGVASVQKEYGTALGYGSNVNVEQAVALGNYSFTNKEATQVSNTTITKGNVDKTFGTYAGTAKSVVSVGGSSEVTERQIINVAPGEVSATSTDAINGSQLYAVADQVVQNQDDIKTVTSTANSTATVVNTKGITFEGDLGTPITKKLGEQIKVYGGNTTEADLTENNIGVVAGVDGLEVKLAKEINLGGDGKLTVGTTVINPNSIATNGLTILNGGPSITVDGINAGNKKITNVLAGTADTDAVNYKQLKEKLAEAKPNISPGNNITIDGPTTANGNQYVINGLNTTVSAATGDKYVKVVPGTAVNGTTDYAVSLTDSAKNAIDAVENKADKSEVASLAKSAIEVKAKGNNVVVESTVTDTKTTYEVSISNALDLTKDGSLTIGTTKIDGTQVAVAGTTINADGITTKAVAASTVTADTVTVGGISITEGGINAGNTQLTNVKSGGDVATNGANIGDVNRIVDAKVSSNANEIINKGMNFKTEEGEVHRNLGDTLEIVGDDSGITTAVKDNKIVISVGDNVMSGKAGQDGRDGSVGATGKDGASVVLNGNDGSIGLTGPKGADGKPGETITIKGVQGQPGVDGEDGISRLEVDGREVATLDDGMVYTGDAGKAAVKLNKTVNLVGGQTDASKLADAPNIGIVASQDGVNGKLTVQLSKNLTGLDSVTTGNTTINNDGLTIKGKDGKDGTVITNEGITINGKDGKDGTVITNEGITINGKDGLTITGKDGKDGISITDAGIDMGGNPISNVGDGISPSDVVTKGQLDRGINKLGNRVNKVGAGAAALAALSPLDFNPDDKWNFAVGYGNYKNADAVAVGAYYQPNEDTRFSVGGTVGSGENMINAGLSIRFGQTNGVSTSRVALAKDVETLKRVVQQLVVENEQLRRGGQGLASGYPDISEREFPDVPKNHWAYEYVDTIAKKGLTIGYPDGEFKGDRTLTRYEFAAVVYRALKNGAEIDAGMARAIDEFGPEIARLEGLDHSRVDRVAGEDNDRYKIERLRTNNKDNEETGDYRDMYGAKIKKDK